MRLYCQSGSAKWLRFPCYPFARHRPDSGTRRWLASSALRLGPPSGLRRVKTPTDWLATKAKSKPGNTARMIDFSLKSMETSGQTLYFYDLDTGTYAYSPDRGQSMERVAGSAPGQLRRISPADDDWSRTRARAAVFHALLREQGEKVGSGARGRNGLLAQLVRIANQHGDSTEGIFYSRGGSASA